MFDEKKVLKALMKGGGIYGDIFAEERTYTHIQLESGRIEKLEKGEDKGVGIRVINPWKTFYASTNSFDEASLIEMADHLARFSEENRDGTDRPGKTYCCRLPVPYQLSILMKLKIEKKLAMVKALEETVKKMERRIKQIRVVYRDTRQKVKMYNRQKVPLKTIVTRLFSISFLSVKKMVKCRHPMKLSADFMVLNFLLIRL